MLSKLRRAIIRNLKKIYKFAIHKANKVRKVLLWHYNYFALTNPKVKGAIPHDHQIQKEIVKELKRNNFYITDHYINILDYKEYMRSAEYHKFSNYYAGGKAGKFIEKSLEHYLAAKVLELSKNDIYIDIASANSPSAQIYRKLYGCRVYRQDLAYPEGINGSCIGGDAGSMPIDDGFVTKMALHCSFEHFEGDADIRFIKEANRVLKKGGKLCILPLCLYNTYAILVDLAVLPRGGIFFEKDAVLYCAKGWKNRHGRFYDVPHLLARIRNNLGGFKLTIHVVQNEKQVDQSCYVKFIALFEKE